MTQKEKIRRCKRCVWNNFVRCGRLFCVLPRCAFGEEVKDEIDGEENGGEKINGKTGGEADVG